MAEKIKFNKNTLREQKQMLGLYLEFLPTLELRKQQLQTELRKLSAALVERRAALASLLQSAAPWSGLANKLLPWVRPLVVIDEVELKTGNIAGVKVPLFQRVVFKPIGYSLLATTPAHDAVIGFFKRAVAHREEIAVMEKQVALIESELTRTTQRINLYEKVLIPQTRENIRRIKVYLGDQQTAAVCRAKIAKAKIVQKVAALQAEVRGG
ncbi:MAG: V-type ATP synthase subunit D [Bradymonadales bacterium]|nr:V-type ATP synthase subunit D [Bradymonadales bacterium]